jgi:hypothetical protein
MLQKARPRAGLFVSACSGWICSVTSPALHAVGYFSELLALQLCCVLR